MISKYIISLCQKYMCIIDIVCFGLIYLPFMQYLPILYIYIYYTYCIHLPYLRVNNITEKTV